MTDDLERDVRDWYEERAGLIQYDGGVPRMQAEAAARRQTAEHFGLSVDQVRRMVRRS